MTAQQGCYPSAHEIVNHDIDMGGSFSLHRSIKSLLPQINSFLISVALLYLIEFGAAYLFGYGWRKHIPITGEFSFRWFALVPIGMLLELVRKYNDDLYVLERDRIIHHSGILSFTYHVPSIRYFDIRAIQVNQGIVGRILNYGNIELSTAAQDRAELTIRGVHAPLALAAFIEEMRSWHRDQDRAITQLREYPVSSPRASSGLPSPSAAPSQRPTH